MAGIISYSTYIPQNRIKLSEISRFWGKDPESARGLGVKERSVAGLDEDTATMSAQAAWQAFQIAEIDTNSIEVVIIGSESHPYVVKPTSTIVGNLLGLSPNYLGLDSEFACKAGSAGLQLISGMVESGRIKNGLVIGADTAQGRPGDALEYTAGSAASAFVLGSQNPIAQILDFLSYSTDTPDFWRREGEKFPSHAGRFSGEPAYFHHVYTASKNLLEKTKTTPKDYDYAVFHMPNGKFPKEMAKRLGFSLNQISSGLIVEKIGNPYSASAMTGLVAVLDIAKPGQKIFVCSYGSGSGSDAFVIKTTPELKNHQTKNKYKVQSQIKNKKNISYEQLIKLMMAKGYLKV